MHINRITFDLTIISMKVLHNPFVWAQWNTMHKKVLNGLAEHNTLIIASRF